MNQIFLVESSFYLILFFSIIEKTGYIFMNLQLVEVPMTVVPQIEIHMSENVEYFYLISVYLLFVIKKPFWL